MRRIRFRIFRPRGAGGRADPDRFCLSVFENDLSHAVMFAFGYFRVKRQNDKIIGNGLAFFDFLSRKGGEKLSVLLQYPAKFHFVRRTAAYNGNEQVVGFKILFGITEVKTVRGITLVVGKKPRRIISERLVLPEQIVIRRRFCFDAAFGVALKRIPRAARPLCTRISRKTETTLFFS